MTAKIYVASHKIYPMPKDPLYQPIWVGHAGSKNPLDMPAGWIGDDTGDNISDKNSSFNELTALYWAWKNSDADVIGLVHYRRYFSMNHKKGLTNILTQAQLDALLKQDQIILPKQRHYYIETNYSHYIHAHHAQPIDLVRTLIGKDFQASYDKIMQRRSQHLFNMMIMSRQELDEYAGWLFPILFQLEKEIDRSDYDAYEKRVFGFVGERLLDIFLDAKGKSFTEIPFVFEEKQNWIKKGGLFLARKVTGGRNGK
ncbi:DUF4422 domain-containing protein [Oenococcus sp.]|uniref:DUF4422 domain-containing protein n=1 Tax=Oenococcus sp. TaxID=1979414 RepID=UPI0039E8C1F7